MLISRGDTPNRAKKSRQVLRSLSVVLWGRTSHDFSVGNDQDAASTPLFWEFRGCRSVSSCGWTLCCVLSFLCAFSLVENLAIAFPKVTACGGTHREVMHLVSTPSFEGKFRLPDIFCKSSPFVELLCELPLRFHTVWVSSHDIGRLVSSCDKTLRSLRITRRTHGVTFIHPPISVDG